MLGRRPPLVDVIGAAVLLVVGEIGFVGGDDVHGRVALALLAPGLTLPLVWRRSAPLIAVLVVFGTAAIVGTIDPDGEYLIVFVALIIACYSVAAYAESKPAGMGIATVWVFFSVGAIRDNVRHPGTRAVGDLLYVWMLTGSAWVVGRIVRTWRLQALALAERTVELEAEREWRARAAVAEERTRIARELHDVIAHSVSVMVVQAAAAEHVVGSQPDQARDALSSIQDTGRQAVLELRRLLGILRPGEAESELAPQPTLGQIERLVGQVRDAGLPVEVRVEGTTRPLPPSIELAAYRVVQEALTNTLKHGGPAAVARVVIAYRSGELAVEVVDSGRHLIDRELPVAGHGLPGMRERVLLQRGQFRAGPAGTSDGFEVSATFPLPVGLT